MSGQTFTIEGIMPANHPDPDYTTYDLQDERSERCWGDIVDELRGQRVRVTVERLPLTRRYRLRQLFADLPVSRYLGELEAPLFAAWKQQRWAAIRAFIVEQGWDDPDYQIIGCTTEPFVNRHHTRPLS